MEYQFEALGPTLRWVALLFLLLFVVAFIAAVVGIAALPGWIARRREHPQAAAINVCGWFGLPTGILWVVAIVWAYLDRYPAKSIADAGDETTSREDVRRLKLQLVELNDLVTKLEDATQ